jgi:hypothetical protein
MNTPTLLPLAALLAGLATAQPPADQVEAELRQHRERSEHLEQADRAHPNRAARRLIFRPIQATQGPA